MRSFGCSLLILVMIWVNTAQAQTPPRLSNPHNGLFGPTPQPAPIRLDPNAPLIKVHHLGIRRTVYEAVSETEHWLFYVYTCRDGTEQLDIVTVFRSRESGFVTDEGVNYFLNAKNNSETTRLIDLRDGRGIIEMSGYNVTREDRLTARLYEIYIVMRFGGFQAKRFNRNLRPDVGFFFM